jgi:hypothetical protein
LVRIYRPHPQIFEEKEKKLNLSKESEEGTHWERCKREKMVLCSDSTTIAVS